MSSILLTRAVATMSCELVTKYLDKMLSMKLIEHDDVWIMVLDPTVKFSPEVDPSSTILTWYKHGKPKEEYKEIAFSKAIISWREGLPSHVVQQTRPYLWQSGDTKWGGSAARDGLVVSCSGLPWQWDWCISNMVIDVIQATTLTGMRKILANEDINILL